MGWKLLEPTPGARAYAVIGEQGDDAVELLDGFARAEGLTAAQLTAVGAFRTATVGWFDGDAKDYRRIEVGEQCEVLSLLGDIAVGAEGPSYTSMPCSVSLTGTSGAGTSSPGRCGRRSRSSCGRRPGTYARSSDRRSDWRLSISKHPGLRAALEDVAG